MSHTRLVTARSPRRTPRSAIREDHMLRVFPGASSSSIAGISNHPQQFYPNSSHLHSSHNQRNQHFNHRHSPHLQGFANTPSSDDANMMDIQLPPIV